MGHDARRPLCGRTGWLRAAALGANYGSISTASLVTGVAAYADGANMRVSALLEASC